MVLSAGGIRVEFYDSDYGSGFYLGRTRAAAGCC